MKQIFTLLAAATISITQSFAQTTPFSESFSGKTISSLTTAGWSFGSGITMGSTPSNGDGLQLASPGSATGTVITNMNTSAITVLESFVNVSFKYGVIAPLNGTRTIEFGFLNTSNNQFTTLGTITATSTNTANTLYLNSFNTTIPANTTIKIQFIITSQNDKNAHLIIDDVRVTSNALAPLPIKLLSFTGAISNGKSQLSWSVAENETGDYFEVQKSSDGKQFNALANVSVTAKEGTESYSFPDPSQITGNTYYRLKIVNKNNTTSYSRIITLKSNDQSQNASLSIVQNPVTSSLQFQYTASASGISKAVVYNAAGVRVMSRDISLQKGTNAVSLNLDNVVNGGTYFLEITQGTERSVAKMIKK